MLTHTATRAEVYRTRTGSLADYSVMSDTLAFYHVIGPVPGDPDRVYVVGRRHNNLALVTRTGRVPVRGHGDQVRVRIDFARDTGENVELAFDDEHIGGIAPRCLFA